jgi:hypothetical protein
MGVSQTLILKDQTIVLKRGFVLSKESISRHVPLRCGGTCLFWVEIFDADELQKILRFLRKVKIKYRVHHPFEDWLVHNTGFEGIILRLRGEFESVTEVEERKNSDQETIYRSGLRLGVSTLWCQIENDPWKDIFGTWTGSVGCILRGGQNICLRGWEYTLEIYKGKKVVYEYFDKKTPLRNFSTTEIVTHVILHRAPKRKQAISKPLRNGELFLKKQGKSLQQKRCGELLEVQDLYGTRLRGWNVEYYSGLISHVPYMKDSGTSTHLHAATDLLELFKGIRDKVQRRMGIEIMLAVKIIGSMKK